MISVLQAGYGSDEEKNRTETEERPRYEDAVDGFLWEDSPEGIRLTRYVGQDRNVCIPARIKGAPVRILGSHAFYENGMDIETITTPDTLRVIEPYACEFCMSLTDFQMAEGVERLGREFLIATQVETLHVPATVRCIEEPAELGISLQIAADNPWYATDQYALFFKDEKGISLECILPGLSLKEYQVPEGVTRIAHDAFESQDGLERILLPASLAHMDEGVLSNPKSHFAKGRGIYRISIAEGNRHFFRDGDGFYYRLPDGGLELVKYLGTKREITLGRQIRVIGQGAFMKSRVARISIPATVDRIFPDAFLDCPLEQVDFQALGFSMYFPADHPYVLKQVLEGFGHAGRLYDFSCYDRVLTDDALNASKAKMIVYRLRYPVDLGPDMAAYFRGRIAEKLLPLTEQLGQKRDLECLQWMGELGFYTAENVDDLIEGLNAAGHSDAMAVLMDYKNRELGTFQAFDFSL